MPCFYNEGRRRKAKEAFWGKRATCNYNLWGMTIIPKLNLRNDSLKRSAVWHVEMLFPYTLLHTKDWMKSFSSFNLCVWACACTCVYFFKCGHTHNGLTCVCPQCHHNVSTPLDVNAVLVGFFFDFLLFFFLPSSFCVCEDANVTQSFYCKQKKKNTLLGLFAV